MIRFYIDQGKWVMVVNAQSIYRNICSCTSELLGNISFQDVERILTRNLGGTKLDFQNKHEDYTLGTEILKYAVEDGQIKVIRFLFSRGYSLIFQKRLKDDYIDTILNCAIKNFTHDITELLLQQVNAEQNYSNVNLLKGNALFTAVKIDNVEAVKLLIKNIDLEEMQEDLESVLSCVVREDKNEILLVLLEHIHTEHLNLASRYHTTHQHLKDHTLLTAIREEQLATVKLLLEYGANPRAIDYNNQTGLDIAQSKSNQAMVKLLQSKISDDDHQESWKLLQTNNNYTKPAPQLGSAKKLHTIYFHGIGDNHKYCEKRPKVKGTPDLCTKRYANIYPLPFQFYVAFVVISFLLPILSILISLYCIFSGLTATQSLLGSFTILCLINSACFFMSILFFIVPFVVGRGDVGYSDSAVKQIDNLIKSGVDPQDIMLYGHSFGGAAVSETLKHFADQGIELGYAVFLNTFSSLEIGLKHFPLPQAKILSMIPNLKRILKILDLEIDIANNVATLHNLKKLKNTQVIIINHEKDRLIPQNAQLLNALKEHKLSDNYIISSNLLDCHNITYDVVLEMCAGGRVNNVKVV